MVTSNTDNGLDRRQVVERLLEANNNLLVITGLGSPTYDVHAAGDRDTHFYLWGAMGSASLIGLGLALAQPEQKVLVITGDGEQLMGLGGLATIGVQNPDNLSIIVLDNGHFGETGMQKSHTELGVSLVKVAQACGFGRSQQVSDMQDVDALAENLYSDTGTSFTCIKIDAKNHQRSLPTLDGVFLKNRIRQHLGLTNP
jgi:thiamine pyrophosphate-dependent acetolactate synthase large subunit-like protein